MTSGTAVVQRGGGGSVGCRDNIPGTPRTAACTPQLITCVRDVRYQKYAAMNTFIAILAVTVFYTVGFVKNAVYRLIAGAYCPREHLDSCMCNNV